MNKLLVVGALVFAGAAFARVVLTHGPNTYELRTRSGTTVSRGHPTIEACEAAITEAGEYRCAPTGIITAVLVCDDLPPPPPVVDAEGFTVLGDVEGHACPEGAPNAYRFTQVQPVRQPYPSCAWVEQPVPITDCVTLTHTWWTAP